MLFGSKHLLMVTAFIPDTTTIPPLRVPTEMYVHGLQGSRTGMFIAALLVTAKN